MDIKDLKYDPVKVQQGFDIAMALEKEGEFPQNLAKPDSNAVLAEVRADVVKKVFDWIKSENCVIKNKQGDIIKDAYIDINGKKLSEYLSEHFS